MSGLFKKDASPRNRPLGDFDIRTENAQLRHSISEAGTARKGADQTGRGDGMTRRASAPIGIQARGGPAKTGSAEGSPLLTGSLGGSPGKQGAGGKSPLLEGRRFAQSMLEQKPPLQPDESRPQAEKKARDSTSRPDSPMMNLMLKMTEI